MNPDEEIRLVQELGEKIGYGNMMEIASALWARKLNDYDGNGISVGADIPILFCAVNDQWWSIAKDSTLKAYRRIENYFEEQNNG